jgi:3-oxoacyl-[acyl-carrier-protein] synthase III
MDTPVTSPKAILGSAAFWRKRLGIGHKRLREARRLKRNRDIALEAAREDIEDARTKVHVLDNLVHAAAWSRKK